MKFLIFARSSHPDGWGWSTGTAPNNVGQAHGYSVLIIRVKSRRYQATLDKVVRHMQYPGFKGIKTGGYYGDGNLGDWFGGQFDHLMTVKGELDIPYSNEHGVCKGDNRMVSVFDIEEVLEVIDAK